MPSYNLKGTLTRTYPLAGPVHGGSEDLKEGSGVGGRVQFGSMVERKL